MRNVTAAGIHGHLIAAHSSTWTLQLATGSAVSTKGSCAAEDEEDDTNTDTSYRCKLFVGDPPQLVAIGWVLATSSTIHTVPLEDNLVRVVVEDVR